MTTLATFLPPPVAAYLSAVGARETAVEARLREVTARLPEAHYQISPEEGQFLAFLACVVGAKRTLDIGTFTGYSALAVAGVLPSDGRIVSFDTSDSFTAIARHAWAEAGVDDRIELVIGPAIDGLDRLIEAGEAGRFDLSFIDADKEGYDAYYERSLVLVRPGGIVALDNTLWRGRVADPTDKRAKTRAFRALNAKIASDPRVVHAMVPIGDGVTVCWVRPG